MLLRLLLRGGIGDLSLRNVLHAGIWEELTEELRKSYHLLFVQARALSNTMLKKSTRFALKDFYLGLVPSSVLH